MDKQQQSIKSQLFQPSDGFGNAALNSYLEEASSSKKDPYDNANAKDEFDFYAQAFHRSGRLLAEQMLSVSGYNDLDACPIVFLYRHALELYLKAIARIGKTILELTGNEQPIAGNNLMSHELSKLFPTLKQVFIQIGWDWSLDIEGLRSFDELEQLLKDFDGIDKISDTFRYPLDTKKKASVPRNFIFNVPKFCHQMDELLSLLEGITISLRVERAKRLRQIGCDEK